MSNEPKTPERHKLLLKVLVAIAWVGGIALAYVAWKASGLPLEEVPAAMARWLDNFGPTRGAVLFVLLYTLRPLVFFPSSLFTAAAGLLFGPWLGCLMTVVGENLGANFAFHLARLLGRERFSSSNIRLLTRLEKPLQEHGRQVVMILRLVYLPFDTVSYGCGLVAVRARDFAIGTLIGSAPALLSLTLLGGAGSARLGSHYRILGFEISQSLFVLGLSGVIFVIGVLLAIRLRKTHRALLDTAKLSNSMS
jgi:uncharacterized membrane protein YdjX (TVP38/TMEM64 family)